MKKRPEESEERPGARRDRAGVRDPLMTTQEVANYLHCSVSTVRRSLMSGQIPHYRLGKIVRFRRSDIDHWLAMHRAGEAASEAGRAGLSDPEQLSLFPAPPPSEG
jgi:excisionase family DNA binding protein